MKTAFAYWEDRVAPVFDIARQIHVVEAEAGHIVTEAQEVLADDLPVQKAIRLSELGVGTLVCGAISRTLHEIVAAYGIQVIPFVAGDLREVIQAWLGGDLGRDAFAMPGCCGRGRRLLHESNNRKQEVYQMRGRRGGGMGPGGGRGQGRGGQGPGGGMGRGRGRQAARGGADVLRVEEAASACLCPKCGHREPHEIGVPCVRKQCPRCGAAMARE